MFRLLAVFMIFTCLLVSCGEEELVEKPNEIVWDPNGSVPLNQGWMEDEQFMIDEFVKRNGWEMTQSESGLRYMIYEQGNLEDSLAKTGQIAWVQFEIAPLGDTVVYRSAKNEVESFIIEMDHIENGLHEAITYMRKGDRAKIILPHFLAHGLLGDNMKIPPLTAVVYDLKLIDIE